MGGGKVSMKHRRTKATDITKQVKMTVLMRDMGICIVCGQQGLPNAHYIPRSQRWTWNRRKHSYVMP